MAKLDARDLDILRVLSTRGRITKADLAEAVGLSASPCWERLRKLEQAGIIEGYHAEISLRKLGPYVRVFVAAELTDHTAAAFRIFEEVVQGYDEITACWAYPTGGIITINAAETEAIQKNLLSALQNTPY